MSFSSISRSLGRTETPTHVPAAPELPQSVVRFSKDNDLASRFLDAAAAAKMHIHPLDPETEISGAVLRVISNSGCRSAAITRSSTTQHLLSVIQQAGVSVHVWDDTSLDTIYDVDIGITDVYAAVAETGSIVIKGSASHGRAVSLVPPIHIAIVRKEQILPDLVDLFAKLAAEGTGSGVVVITGPSKTADIEMNLVTGVHGPGEVHILLV